MRVFMFTVATNGYQWLYHRHLKTQAAYARRQRYDYYAFTLPRKRLGAESSAWLKISLALRALRENYDLVFFVDADCEMLLHAPPVTSVLRPEKQLYMCLGPSGRLNSGVFIVRRHPESMSLFVRMLAGRSEAVPAESKAPYENGHVIHHATGSPFLSVLDRHWNDYRIRDGQEYVRHWGGTGRRRWARLARWIRRSLALEDARFRDASSLPPEELTDRCWRVMRSEVSEGVTRAE